MYGIISFNKGAKCPTTEFRAKRGKYGRGAACQECRISKLRCSGRLYGKACDRCKRLSKSCLYISSQNQRPNLSKCPSAASTRNTSPEQQDSGNHPLEMPDSSSQSSSNGTQFVTDDPYELDFEQWRQVHSTSALTEPAQLPQTVSAQNLQIIESLNDFDLSPLQPELSSPGVREAYEALTFQFSGLNNIEAERYGMEEHELMASESWDPQDWIYDARGFVYQCTCLQSMSSCLAILRSWPWGEGSKIDGAVEVESPAFNSAKGEDFLNIFEKSMAQLHIVENCPPVCKMSRDLALLTFLVIEQLARLLRNLASDVTGGVGHINGYPLGIFLKSTHHLPGIQTTVSLNLQKNQDIWIARIGTFEITDSFELQMIMKLLLKLKSQALNGYISRWIDEMKHYEMKDLEIDLRRIQEDLRNVVFLENVRESSSLYYSQTF